MSAHTPGPWKFDAGLGCKAIKGGKRGAAKQAQYTEIAYTVGLNNDHEDEANARLISAAPDMYEALKASRECILGRTNIEYRKHGESTPLQDIYEELIAQIDAALAKAGQ